jgi:hypothetical protein
MWNLFNRKSRRLRRNVRPSGFRLEMLEDRVTPSWGQLAPTSVTAPTSFTSVSVNSFGVASGSADISSNEVDWYQVLAPATGPYQFTAGNSATNFDAVLGVYDAKGVRIAYGDDVNYPSDLSAATAVNLTAGKSYFVGITNYIGKPGGTYSWTVTGPAYDDGFEDNDQLSQAVDLGTMKDQTYRNLAMSLDSSDYYRITLPATGTSLDTVAIDYQVAQGDLDLEIVNAQGGRITSSQSATNEDKVSLKGLAAGNYYVHVFGSNGARNPSYTMTFTHSFDDGFENNDTQGSASNLGVIDSSKVIDNLVLNDAADWYKFTTAGPSTAANNVQIDFNNADGDLNLALYFANGKQISSSANTGVNTESISLQGLPAGTYFAKVDGAVNPHYKLSLTTPPGDDPNEPNNTLATASDFGKLAGTKSIADLAAINDDWFKFTTVNTGQPGNGVTINFDHTQGNLDLELYSSTSKITPIAASRGSGDSEFVSLTGLPKSTYYVRIFGFQGATNPSYSMNITAPVSDDGNEPNNTFATARSIGTPQGGLLADGLVLLNDDWYKFNTVTTGATNSRVDLQFNNADGDLDLKLYDKNGNELATSAGSSNIEEVSLAGRPADTYYIKVYGFNGAINPHYSFTVWAPPPDDAFDTKAPPPHTLPGNNTPATATDLGTLTAGKQGQWKQLRAYDLDWYKFTIPTGAVAQDLVKIDFDHTAGNIDLFLFDATGKTLLGSSTGTGDEESISLGGLRAGTYTVMVCPIGGARNPNYTLSIDGPPKDDSFENNNTMQKAADLGSLTGNKTVSGLRLLDDDWYKFGMSGYGSAGDFVEADFLNSAGDLDLELYDELGNQVGVSRGTTNQELISLNGLFPGIYFIHAYGYQGAHNADYTLQLHPAAPISADDHFEENDTLAQAFNLGKLTATKTVSGLKMMDEADWFQFTTVGEGRQGDSVSIAFKNAQGDLDLELYDLAGNLLASSPGSGDSESVSLANLAPGSYAVKIFGYAGARNPSYTLTIKPPAADDAFGPNSTRATAHDFKTLNGFHNYSNLTLATAADWYKFTTTATGGVDNVVEIDFSNAAGNLNLHLFDSNGTEIHSGVGTDDFEIVTLSGLAAGTYYLEVDGASNPCYTLTVSAPTSANWYAQTLSDPNLRSLVQTYNTNDGSIDRNEALRLFEEVRQDGTVSASEFRDLTVVANDTSVIAMPDPVRVLFEKVVDGDPANAHYQTQALGNLAADSKAAQLEKLVDKWFLGMDHPVAEDGATYDQASGNLFGGPQHDALSYQDIKQGDVGDCYFLSSLGTVALNTPQVIRNMFIDNGDGTWTVRFIHGAAADYVTVDRYLPAFQGQFVYANTGNSVTDPNNVLWVALAEKAYAELNESGWIGRTTSANSYASIGYGYSDKPINQISGATMAGADLAGVTFDTLRANFDARAYVTIASRGDGVADNVVPSHMYLMVGYDAVAQTVTLFNPWGVGGGDLDGTHRDGFLTLNISDLNTNFDWYSFKTA